MNGEPGDDVHDDVNGDVADDVHDDVNGDVNDDVDGDVKDDVDDDLNGGGSGVDDRIWSGEWVAGRLGVRLHGEGLRELLGLALRRNPKRAHLLVSQVLGKHVPQRPSTVHGVGVDLGRRVRAVLGDALADRAVVLGYAETATGLGHSVADGIGGVTYLHSTRRAVPGVASAGGFEEEHSHATSHLLLPEDPELLAGDGPLVLVDDEFSTGRTVRNTVAAVHRRHPRDRYVVVVLTDMRSKDDTAALEKSAAELGARVDVVALARGTAELPEDVLERGRRLVAEAEAAAGASAGAPAEAAGAEAAGRAEVAVGTPAEAAEAAANGRAEAASGRDSASGGEAADGAGAAGGVGPSAGAGAVRVDLGWPPELPDGGRHGFTARHGRLLDACLPAMGSRLAEALARVGGTRTGSSPSHSAPGDRRRRVLVLGSEELMYAPLRLACALEEQFAGEAAADGAGGETDVYFSTTTRSPVLAVDDPAYAVRTSLTFPAHDGVEGERYVYNVAPGADPARRFDAVVVCTDSAGDTPALHAPGGLLHRLRAHTDAVLLAVVPSYHPLRPPLRGPQFSSYAPDDVGWLLQDFSDIELEAPVEEREEAIQNSGAHYAESLPVEYQPGPEYKRLFHGALAVSARRVARAVGAVTEAVLTERAGRGSGRPVLVSLARAGTPVGVLMRRWAQRTHGVELPHYAISIVRGRGIDTNALKWLALHHDPADLVFVDGWTGKGAITRELADAVAPFPDIDPEIAVLADPGGCVRTYGTREDFLIPSACLNSTVSGLISRTVLRADLVGRYDYHGAKFYRALRDADVSGHFLDAITGHFAEVAPGAAEDAAALLAAGDRAPTWAGLRAVERISEEYGIGDVNLVKPGVGETTRVLLRRVPWRILARRGAGSDLDHVRLLAGERGVPVEETDELPYSCVGLVHPRYTRGATGADGRAAR